MPDNRRALFSEVRRDGASWTLGLGAFLGIRKCVASSSIRSQYCPRPPAWSTAKSMGRPTSRSNFFRAIRSP